MGSALALVVSFPADGYDSIARLAKSHLDWLSPIDETKETRDVTAPLVRWFLREVSVLRGKIPGPRGGMFLWGTQVTTKVDVERFVAALENFWRDLLKADFDDGPRSSERILIFNNSESNGQMDCTQIWLDEDGELLIDTHHDLPFTWIPY